MPTACAPWPGNRNALFAMNPHRLSCGGRPLGGALLLFFHGYDFAALVIAAVGADVVRQHRLLAARAVLDLDRLEVLVAAPLALAGVGGTSLGDCHVCSPSVRGSSGVKLAMLGGSGKAVKTKRGAPGAFSPGACEQGGGVRDNPFAPAPPVPNRVARARNVNG